MGGDRGIRGHIRTRMPTGGQAQDRPIRRMATLGLALAGRGKQNEADEPGPDSRQGARPWHGVRFPRSTSAERNVYRTLESPAGGLSIRGNARDHSSRTRHRLPWTFGSRVRWTADLGSEAGLDRMPFSPDLRRIAAEPFAVGERRAFICRYATVPGSTLRRRDVSRPRAARSSEVSPCSPDPSSPEKC